MHLFEIIWAIKEQKAQLDATLWENDPELL